MQQFLQGALANGNLDGLVSTLRPLLRADDPAVAARALRLVEAGRLRSLADAVESLLDREAELSLLAAETLAILRGRAAAPVLREKREAATSFAQRASYSALLQLLGEADTQATREIEAAWIARRLRTRLLTLTPEYRPTGGGLLGALFGGNRSREPETPKRDEWRSDGEPLHVPHWASLVTRFERAEGERRLALAPMSMSEPADELQLPDNVASDRAEQSAAGPVAGASLSPVAWLVTPHGLHVSPAMEVAMDAAMEAALVASEPDGMRVQSQPLPLRLHAYERWLEPWFFVQFAAEAKSPAGLRDRWQAWWKANAEASPDDWWKRALEQAVAELSDERWWVRTQALGRLERLTGRTTESASPWDREAWQARVVEPWDAWLQSKAAADPLAALRASVEQSPLPVGHTLRNAGEASATAAELTDLITLAGWGSDRQHAAALAQLARWPDRKALLKEALRWQHSPRPELQAWIASRKRGNTPPPRVSSTPHSADRGE